MKQDHTRLAAGPGGGDAVIHISKLDNKLSINLDILYAITISYIGYCKLRIIALHIRKLNSELKIVTYSRQF